MYPNGKMRIEGIHHNLQRPFLRPVAIYREARPTYSPKLFDWFASIAADRELAWDCGCGNGQAARLVVHPSEYFECLPPDLGLPRNLPLQSPESPQSCRPRAFLLDLGKARGGDSGSSFEERLRFRIATTKKGFSFQRLTSQQ